MKKTNIFYWVFTGLFAFLMLSSAIPDIISHPMAIQGMHEELGYPVYFVPFIGVAKLLGVAAILIPGFHRLKEWAYAGLFFDLIGATFSIVAIGKPDWMFMVLPLGLATASYVFYNRRRKFINQETGVLGGVAF
ncbi:DoxX family protein [Niastella caeni]|uniref:DoxX family protein n=1 Tax=Niastella caeni TaxID=2569763 RepID=A0A4S8HVT9_9BACT|nr:DoxX family protein [Niastella caeni]THU38164.1 DoxX family protein [Niastella caeni]